MKSWKRIPLLVVLLQTGGVGGLEGQLLDWIHKMSGIGEARVAIFQTVDIKSPAEVHAVSFTAMLGFQVSDGEDPDAVDADIKMQSFQVAIETPVLGSGMKTDVNLLGMFGLAGHRFGGDNSFVTGSFPAQLILRIPLGSTGRSAIRLGTGFNIFWFPDDASPVTSETAGFEAAWGLSAGVDIDII